MKLATAIIFGLMSLASYGASREIDYAAEDAAVKTIQEITERSFPINNIAFVGLSNDRSDLSHVFRSGLLRVPGVYNFFTRDNSEFNLIVKEIEFGERREDVMDSTTIKRFGKIKGVDALLYGKIQESTAEGTNGIFRVALTLADVETGQLLWTGNITGTYTAPVERENINQKVIEAAVDAGQKMALKIAENRRVATSDIFILPLVGKMSSELSDILTTEIASNNSNSAISFYTEPTSVNMNTVRNLSYKLAGEGYNRVNQAQLGKILKQLDQIYNIQDQSSVNSTQPDKAYMIGTIINATEPEHGKEAKVTITFKLRSCINNQLITGATITGISSEEALTNNETLMKMWDESGILIKLIAGVTAALIAVTVFLLFIRMITGVR